MSDNFICDLYICCAGNFGNKKIYEKSTDLFNFLSEKGINCKSNFNKLVHDKDMAEIASKSRLFLLLTDGEIKVDNACAILKTATVYQVINGFYQRFFSGANFGYAKVFCLNECALLPQRMHVIFQNTNHFNENDSFELILNWVKDILLKEHQQNNEQKVIKKVEEDNYLLKNDNEFNQIKIQKTSDFVIENNNLIKYKGSESVVIIPNGIKKIEDRAFYNNSSLLCVCLPSSVQTICEYAFANCKNLVDINFPSSLKRIERGAFSGCESIKMLDFNNSSIEYIGENAFWGCNLLFPVLIPLSVKEIGRGAFEGIKDFIVRCEHTFEPKGFEDGWEGMGDPFWLAKDANPAEIAQEDDWVARVLAMPMKPSKSRGKDGMNYFSNDFHVINGELVYVSREIERVEIPSGTKSLAPHLFCDRADLKEVVFPATLIKIGAGAFAKTGIENLVIPANVKIIDEYAFFGCKNLKSVKFSKGVQSLENNLFANCNQLCEINIPNSVEIIKDAVFQGCKQLTQIKIPNSVKEFGKRVFMGAENCVISLSEGIDNNFKAGWNGNCKVVKKNKK